MRKGKEYQRETERRGQCEEIITIKRINSYKKSTHLLFFGLSHSNPGRNRGELNFRRLDPDGSLYPPSYSNGGNPSHDRCHNYQRDEKKLLFHTECPSVSFTLTPSLEYVPRQILILHNLAQHLLHILRVDFELLPFFLRRLKADLVEHPFHNRMQSPRPNIFRTFVYPECKARDFFQRVGSELQLHAFGLQQRDVLPRQRRLRFGQNADEVFHGQRVQFHTNRETSLQFGNQVARLRNVKRARGDEENVVGANHAIARVDRSALDNRENVALHAFARNIRTTMTTFAPGDLVDFIEEDDAGVFDAVDGSALDLLHIDQALLFFLDQVFKGLVDLHLPLLGALPEDVGEHVLEIDVHLFDALVRDDFKRGKITLASFDFDGAVVELALAQLLPQFLPRTAGGFGQAAGGVDDHASGRAGDRIGGSRRSRRQKNIEQSFFGIEFRAVGHVFELLFANHLDRNLNQVADHGFHVAAHISDLGEFRSFDLQERRIRQLGETARDFGFAHAGGADHDDVFGNDLFGHFGRKLLPAHAVAQGDGDGALRVFLPDNILVQFGDDFARRQFVERDLFFFGGSG